MASEQTAIYDSNKDANLTNLVSGLTKFLEWQDEYDLVRSHTSERDAAHRLMQVLQIPDEDVRVLIGGSNCPIFQRAADEIERLRREHDEAWHAGYSQAIGDAHTAISNCDPYADTPLGPTELIPHDEQKKSEQELQAGIRSREDGWG